VVRWVAVRQRVAASASGDAQQQYPDAPATPDVQQYRMYSTGRAATGPDAQYRDALF
jgi:hypothetical protein